MIERVYFIANNDRSMIKIGRSTNIGKRLSALQSGSPTSLQILASAPGTSCDERALHAKFIAHHRHGEWFCGHSEILELISTIVGTNEIPSEFRGNPNKRYALLIKGSSRKRTPEQIKRVVDGVKHSNERRWAAMTTGFPGQHPGHA